MPFSLAGAAYDIYRAAERYVLVSPTDTNFMVQRLSRLHVWFGWQTNGTFGYLNLFPYLHVVWNPFPLVFKTSLLVRIVPRKVLVQSCKRYIFILPVCLLVGYYYPPIRDRYTILHRFTNGKQVVCIFLQNCFNLLSAFDIPTAANLPPKFSYASRIFSSVFRGKEVKIISLCSYEERCLFSPFLDDIWRVIDYTTSWRFEIYVVLCWPGLSTISHCILQYILSISCVLE